MVEGYGKPYGTTYGSLEQLQGVLSVKSLLIPIGNGMYLRFLDKIPIVTDDLRIDKAPFYAQRPVMYFASNSESQIVKEWVMGSGLLNFSLVPASMQRSVPEIRFTPKYAFLTQNLFLNMDLYFKPSMADKARETYALSVTTSDWPFDRHQYFLQYKHFGNYSTPAGALAPSDETVMIADVVKKIEDTINTDVKETAKMASEAGTATKHAADSAKTEVAKASARVSGEGLDKGDQVVI
jgi:hypothetical protein